MKAKAKTYYYLMLAAMVVRLFWLVAREPQGASRALAAHPEWDTMAGLAVHSLPFVVYPSIVILVIILVAALLRKPWAYIAGIVFGATHFVLTLLLVVMGVNPGFGPTIVLPACVLMVVFSFLTRKHTPATQQF